MTDQHPLEYAVVVPTLDRPSLATLLRSLAAQGDPLPTEVVVVDDRPVPHPDLELPDDVTSHLRVRVALGLGRGPAAARNLGWQLCDAPWVSFLDDDVVLPDGWAAGLQQDLSGAAPGTAGSQGRLTVPLPADRRPTDWERSTAGLEHAVWATADMVYRRSALVAVAGFDERFPRAYREDADLALRIQRAGWRLEHGQRRALHPVRPASPAASVRVQRGNADDALFRRLHGRTWRRDAQTGRGRLGWHAVTVLAAAIAAGAASRGRRSPGWRTAGTAAAVTWLGLTADLARRRIAPGPRDRREVSTMLWTSVVIPWTAVCHRLRGWWSSRGAAPWPPAPRAVLFDRDGTLVHDVPYNGDVAKVSPVPGAAEAVARVRAGGLLTGVVTNQSGIGRGLVSPAEVAAVNATVDARLGPFDTWAVCPHRPDDGCSCRKPGPGMVLAAAKELGVHPAECVVIGDIGADVQAARAAGARSILVPTTATRPEEVASAPVRAPDLGAAVDLVLGSGHG